ncbi:MAG TPA: aminotransferase class V-fold PLP-dependent enzyme [Flavobacteriales bacterium]|nr:aminotransferase class V-fold PLP-dependent enzyme [Flavobacteriales bacterium]
MESRRKFLKAAGAFAGAMALSPLLSKAEAATFEEKAKYFESLDPVAAMNDEDFWSWVRESFTVSTNIINLNNGGVAPQPKVVQDAHIRYYQLCNEGPSYYMWRILDAGREPLRAKLAKLAGVSPEEIAINRNSTEGLNTVIFGLNLKAGDEVILSKYDYPNMMNAWKQREKREGIKLVWLDPVLPFQTDDEFVNLYAKAITSKTKVVHITHMINWTGQFVPAKKIADIAHAKGCEVIVDGAHSFGHTDFKIEDTGADYFATSLHKWLNAPFGSGMLYIKKDKIKNIWALLSNDKPDGDDIRKFESLGTRSFASEMAISAAIDFHNVIGGKRKEERLRFLKNHWCEQVKDLKNVTFNTPRNAPYGCAIMNFSIEGWEASEIEKHLFDKKKVHTVAIKFEKLNGVRVAPSIYTSTADLDILVEGIQEMAKMEPPKKS